MFRLCVLLTFALTQCEITEKMGSVEAEMMGVNTVHDAIKIDKDTIITRNLKLDKLGKSKKSNNLKTEEREPDWSYSPVPEEVSGYVAQFKNNMTECLKEVQENDKRTVRRLSPKPESPVHGECLIACVLKRSGVIEHRKVNKENLLALVSKFYAKDTKLMKKLEKHLDGCIETSAHNRDECDLAAKLNECTNGLMTTNKHKVVVKY